MEVSYRDWKPFTLSILGTHFAFQIGRRLLHYLKDNKEEWIPIGVVGDLYIYPVKSGVGTKSFSLNCQPFGVTCGKLKDRHFMVINENTKHFYTARQLPLLLKLSAEITTGKAVLKFLNETMQLELGTFVSEENRYTVTLFDQLSSECYDCGDGAAAFLHQHLQTAGVRLVMFHESLTTQREYLTEGFWLDENKSRGDKTAFADLAPILLATNSSLQDLNERLEKKISMRSFRPNIVLNDTVPWAEDNWCQLRIGQAELQILKPCVRCIMTTIDPDTCDRNKQMEPLTTLKKFRVLRGKGKESLGTAPTFGIDCAVITPGYCCKGDVVYAKMRRRFQPSYN